MNFHQLIQQRGHLQRQARLANVAFAYDRLARLAHRITRAQLHGPVILRASDPDGGRPWPMLIAQLGSQAVIEEHFTDEDIVDLADLLGFVGAEFVAGELAFPLEEVGERYLPPLERELARAGVRPTVAWRSPGDPNAAGEQGGSDGSRDARG